MTSYVFMDGGKPNMAPTTNTSNITSEQEADMTTRIVIPVDEEMVRTIVKEEIKKYDEMRTALSDGTLNNPPIIPAPKETKQVQHFEFVCYNSAEGKFGIRLIEAASPHEALELYSFILRDQSGVPDGAIILTRGSDGRIVKSHFHREQE